MATAGLTRGGGVAQDDLSKIYPQLMSDVNIIRLIELQARHCHLLSLPGSATPCCPLTLHCTYCNQTPQLDYQSKSVSGLFFDLVQGAHLGF